MKKWIVTTLAAVTLAGCADIPHYGNAIKTPPPATLSGNWQTMGPQKGLVSKEAIASLIITPDGDTLDCRQWQRVIAKPGKITRFDGAWVNVNNKVRVMPLELEGTELHYDKLVLQRVDQPTAECRDALAHENEKAVAQPAAPVGNTSKKHHKMMMKNEKS